MGVQKWAKKGQLVKGSWVNTESFKLAGKQSVLEVDLV